MPGFVVDGTDSIITKLVGGGARASLFQASFQLLGEDGKAGAPEAKTFSFMCKGIQIPATSAGVVNVNYMGRGVKIPGVRVFEDLTTTILNDEDYGLRNKVENWMHKINSHFGNVRSKKFENKLGTQKYSTDMSLQSLGKAGGVLGTWTFYNIFPTSLDQIDVNWEPNDAIMEYAVTWSYDYWTMK